MTHEEKIGGTRVRDHYKEQLEDLISKWYLIDIKPKYGICTWSNRRTGANFIAKKIDRVLVNSNILE